MRVEGRQAKEVAVTSIQQRRRLFLLHWFAPVEQVGHETGILRDLQNSLVNTRGY